MNVNIIHSGSSGNLAVIDDTLIIDAGYREAVYGKVVFLTHAHTDHTKHLDKIQGMPIYALEETALSLRAKWPYSHFTIIQPQERVEVWTERFTYIVIPIRVKHDVPCVAFDIQRYDNTHETDLERIFWGTDFSYIEEDERIVTLLRDKAYDAIYIECNNTLSSSDMVDCYVYEDGVKPKDEFHRRRSYGNHCSVDYLIGLFKRAGYSEGNKFTEPVTLLHKSSYYYARNPERIVNLCKIASVRNPLMSDDFSV